MKSGLNGLWSNSHGLILWENDSMGLRTIFTWTLETKQLDNKNLLTPGRPQIKLENDPEPRGVIFPKYEPVGITPEPVREFWTFYILIQTPSFLGPPPGPGSQNNI